MTGYAVANPSTRYLNGRRGLRSLCAAGTPLAAEEVAKAVLQNTVYAVTQSHQARSELAHDCSLTSAPPADQDATYDQRH